MQAIPQFGLFLAAALVLALIPGPGMLYVLARTLRGGRSEGLASAGGTALGGTAHVVAAALGLSTLLATSAEAFTIVKYAGAAYLVYLGLHTLFRTRDLEASPEVRPSGSRKAFYQGIMTEVLNPKTALFFLAFIPQFIDPHGPVIGQFLALGTLSVALNTSADLIVVLMAGALRRRIGATIRQRRGQRIFSGLSMVALGAYVAASGDQS